MKKKEKYSILYVDDEEINLRVFQSLYRRSYNIVTTLSPKKCLELFDQYDFDIVVSDQLMPGMSGLELLALIKKKNSLIPTFLLTGTTDVDVLKDAFNNVGIHKFINKPFDSENLSIIMELAARTYRLNLRHRIAQKSLLESEAKYRGMFNSIADVFIRVNNESDIVFVSPSIEQLTGYSSEELLGEKVVRLYVEPDDRAFLLSALSKKEIVQLETLIYTKSKEKVYVSSTSKWYYENGVRAGIESVVRNISEQKALEIELKEQKEFLNEVQHMANLGSWQWDLKNNSMMWSETLCDIYGVNYEKSTSREFSEYLSFLHHQDKKRVRKILIDAARTREDFSYEERILSTNGEERILSSSGKVILDDLGNAQKLTVACLDITEAKLREKTIEESEENFRLLAEGSPVRTLKVNRRLEVEYANPLAMRGLVNNDLGNQLLSNFFVGEIKALIISLVNEVFVTNNHSYTEFQEGEGADRRWVALNVSPLRDYKRIDSVLLMFHDITDKKESERILKNMNEELEIKVKKRTQDLEKAKSDLEVAYKQEKELSNLKSQFVSTASHQFRTPLTVIQSNIGLLELYSDRMTEDFKAKFDKVNRRIQSEIARMTDLMDNVLILGKKESGSIRPKLQMVDLLELTQSIVIKYNQIQDDGRTIDPEISGTPALFHLDPELYENAFSNLVSNAFKYSKNKKAPILQIAFDKVGCVMILRDFGLGIPQKDQENIFEPFFRATNVSGIVGTGLGTSIAKAYFDLLSIEVELESKVHKGTKFTIKLKQ